MALTDAQLATYVQAGTADAAFVTSCLLEATTMVTRRTAGRDVPQEIEDRATLEVGADLYYRRRTRNGVADFEGDDMQPFRVSRDPMVAAYPILAPYLGGGFA